MTANKHRLVGRFQVPIPPSAAFRLFTPLGEREWAHGWEPRFPVPVLDDSEPGTVFETESHGRHTYWVVTKRATESFISYACVTPGDRAGTIAVALRAVDHTSEVEVTYELTPLVPEASDDVQRFADGYATYLESWQQAISVLLSHPAG